MPPSEDRGGTPSLFDQLYKDPGGPPWDIGEAQPELVSAVWDEHVLGPRVLDVGCGAGDNAVLLAMHGFEVTAFDFHEVAVRLARERVAAAGSLRGSVAVLQADVFKLSEVPEISSVQFDTAIDSAVFHCIGDDHAQERYLRALAACVRPEGRLIMHACSDRNPDPWDGPPRRISEAHARSLLEATGWRIDAVQHCQYQNKMGFQGGSCPAILIVATRLEPLEPRAHKRKRVIADSAEGTDSPSEGRTQVMFSKPTDEVLAASEQIQGEVAFEFVCEG